MLNIEMIVSELNRQGYECKAVDVSHRSHKGIRLKLNESVSQVVCPDTFDVSSEGEAVQKCIALTQEAMKNLMHESLLSITKELLLSFDKAADKLRLCIASAGTNHPDVVTFPYLDLELYLKLIIAKDSERTCNTN